MCPNFYFLHKNTLIIVFIKLGNMSLYAILGISEWISSVGNQMPIAMLVYKISLVDLEMDIAALLEENVNLVGDPKLFVVICGFQCIKELLIQVKLFLQYIYNLILDKVAVVRK